MHEQMQSESIKGEKSFFLSLFSSFTFNTLKEGRSIFGRNQSPLCSWVGTVNWEKLIIFLCICYCVFLEAMGYGPRSCVILQEMVIALTGIRVFLLAFVYGHQCKPAGNSKYRHSPNDHCVSCDTCVWGSSNNHFINCLLIPEGKTTPEFRVGGCSFVQKSLLSAFGLGRRVHVAVSLSINKHFERI